jgi:hypothetical protein
LDITPGPRTAFPIFCARLTYRRQKKKRSGFGFRNPRSRRSTFFFFFFFFCSCPLAFLQNCSLHYISLNQSNPQKKREGGPKRNTRGFIHSFSAQKQAAEPKQKEEQPYIKRIYKNPLNPTNQN